ncbi:MAG: 2-oxoacid:acceptor oxidoreductase family protein [Gammaproteobacteria bacterium]|nr:2-oxoacid:acceptor oxidoreductase family protein [Gammaproteobacteria bacterium]
MRTEVRFSGVGGQGIVLAGRLLGKAAALFDGKHAVCTQSYGPEARGGASRADVVISDAPVDYPFVRDTDVLVVFFQEAYAKFQPSLKPGSMLILESDLVQHVDGEENYFGLPATRIAGELGSQLATNVVMLGYLIGKTNIVSRESAEESIRATVKESAVDLDLQALAAGIQRAKDDEA